MSIESTAALVLPVLQNNAADATGGTGVLVRAATTTGSVAHTIPSGAKGRWVDLLVVGANTQYAVTVTGDTAPTLVYNQAVTMGTGHAAAGGTLTDSNKEPVWFPSNVSVLTVISSSALGFFEARVSGPKK